MTRKKRTAASPIARKERVPQDSSGERSFRTTRAKASRKEVRSVDAQPHAPVSGRLGSRFRTELPNSSTTREARAAELRMAYERGELCSTESVEQMAARNAAYVAFHLSPAPTRIVRQVGVPLKAVTEAIHRKHLIQKKPWKQCFCEFYAEGGSKPLKSKIREFERGVRKNVKAKEARLQKKKNRVRN